MSSAFRSMTRRSGSIGRYRTAESCQVMDGNPELHGDRAYTIRITFISLAIGLAIAAVVGLILISLRQPLTVNNNNVNWTFGAFIVPLAGLFSMAVLAWAVFFFPEALARRQDRILHPHD